MPGPGRLVGSTFRASRNNRQAVRRVTARNPYVPGFRNAGITGVSTSLCQAELSGHEDLARGGRRTPAAVRSSGPEGPPSNPAIIFSHALACEAIA